MNEELRKQLTQIEQQGLFGLVEISYRGGKPTHMNVKRSIKLSTGEDLMAVEDRNSTTRKTRAGDSNGNTHQRNQ
jgi:hypothetical protein